MRQVPRRPVGSLISPAPMALSNFFLMITNRLYSIPTDSTKAYLCGPKGKPGTSTYRESNPNKDSKHKPGHSKAVQKSQATLNSTLAYGGKRKSETDRLKKIFSSKAGGGGQGPIQAGPVPSSLQNKSPEDIIKEIHIISSRYVKNQQQETGNYKSLG
jgi:hypothetical protein